jgi:hypothetical protein
MFQIRIVVALLLTMAFLPGKLAAQYSSSDSGEYVILSAQYGTSMRHVDVTNRLKELARQDRNFRMGNSTFGVDPDPGQEKSLRIYARGPDGQERMFEYREGSVVDGSQFRSWGRGDWGTGGWSGRWESGVNDGDSGQYVILSAQYGTARRHVDVTSRLKELARQDRTFRMGNSTFGVDPDRGREKSLRIYARGADGQERMFEYREGSVVDGSQFRSWGRGDWGNGSWSGRWEGRGRHEPQPEMTAAIQHLREAQQNLESATADKGGHRVTALQHINQAIAEVEAGIRYDDTHLTRDEMRMECH